MSDQIIIESDSLETALTEAVSARTFDRLFLLADTNTERLVLPLIIGFISDFSPRLIILPPGEENKNLTQLSRVWEALADGGATRKSLLINLGGGVITDMGGFAAACFKRGIDFINVPTTLLAAVDAAVGGKTGVDFNGLKNEIGAFAPASAVILSTLPFATLPEEQIFSGFAEIVKMTMIGSAQHYNAILADGVEKSLSAERLPRLLSFAVREKERIVKEDPRESGLRKILNFGHTAGHAFETLLLRRGTPVSHGCAVAHGILVALILGHLRLKADSMLIHTYAREILRPLYGRLPLNCKDIEPLMEIMAHDKKNSSGKMAFILIESPGHPVISEDTPRADIRAALELYFDI